MHPFKLKCFPLNYIKVEIKFPFQEARSKLDLLPLPSHVLCSISCLFTWFYPSL